MPRPGWFAGQEIDPLPTVQVAGGTPGPVW